MVVAVNGNQLRLLPFSPGSPSLPPPSLLVMSKGKERKRKREGKGREGETGDDVGKVPIGFTREGGREGEADGGYRRRKKKSNLSTKYTTNSKCIKNI